MVGTGLHGDGGLATQAQLISPVNVVVDAAGNLYIADSAVIRKVTPDGIISTRRVFWVMADRQPRPD